MKNSNFKPRYSCWIFTNYKMNSFRGFALSIKSFFLLILVCLPLVGAAQSTSPTNRTPGAPAGSYQVSEFANVNLFTGNLNFNLSLLEIGGRGEIRNGLGIAVEGQWNMQEKTSAIEGYVEHNYSFKSPNPLAFTGSVRADGYMYSDNQSACNTYPTYWVQHQFNLSYVEPDGTEHMLVDPKYHGRPFQLCGGSNVDYGRIFESTDGSFMTFVADQNVTTQAPPDGNLMFKNGTKLRIESGRIMWMKDRNGNKTEYTYEPNFYAKLTKIRDSIGREVNIAYDANESAPYGHCTKITFDGFGGEDRTIRVSHDDLSNLIRATQPYDLSSIPAIEQDDPNDNILITSTLEPRDYIKAVWLPDGRSYQFKYNGLGQLARVELPTGGAEEYDYADIPQLPFPSGTITPMSITNSVSEKRVYNTNNTLEQVTKFSNPTSFTSGVFPQGRVGVVRDIEQFDSNNNRIAKSRHYFYGVPSVDYGYIVPWWHGKEVRTETFASDGTTILRVVENDWRQRVPSWCYNNQYVTNPCGLTPPETGSTYNPFLVETKMTLVDDNLVSKVSAVDPATGAWAFDAYNNQTDFWTYDYGIGQPGAFLKRTHTDFVNDTNYTSRTGTHLRGLPSGNWTSSDAGGVDKVSQTEFKYDETTLEPRNNVIGWINPANPYRGNLTKTRSWVKYGSEPESWLESRVEYDVLGNVVKTIDAKGYVSTIDYTDRFGSPDGEARTNTVPNYLNAQNTTVYPLNGQNTFAFPTSATNAFTNNALNWVKGYSQVDYFTGSPVDNEDINGVVNTTFYNDALDRPTQSIAANNQPAFRRQSTIVYDDDPATRKIVSTGDLYSFGDNLSKSDSYYDGLGRTTETRGYEANGEYVAVQTKYDALGRPYKQSNPFRLSDINANNPILWTESKFDSLGRVYETKTPDGAKMLTAYDGNRTLVTDQAGKQSISRTNALGQLKDVWEVTAPDSSTVIVNFPNQSLSTGYQTSYQYDTLGRMVKVQQGSQSRFFKYDSLGRLLRVRQPEQQINAALDTTGDAYNNQWTAGFTYDDNGNILTMIDANNKTITNNNYDALNRPASKTYSDGITPTVTYTYDDSSVPYSKGKLTKVVNSNSTSQTTAFDALGRALTYQQITDGMTYASSYQYNLSGALVQETYPLGRTVKNDFDVKGDISRIYGKASAAPAEQTYADTFVYTADGKIKSLHLGNNLWESAKFNSRLQVTELNLGNSATDGSLWKLGYDYGELNVDGTVDATKNAGNIAKQTVSFNGLTNPFVQTYKYDSLNRLTEAKEMANSQQTWIQNFGYDRYGNRTAFSQTVGTQQLVLNNQNFPQVDQNTTTNRFATGQGYNYDFNGNIIADAQGRQFTFDGENKQTLVKDASNNVIGTYYYDGEGKRVKKVTNTETTIFVYSGAKLIQEYSTAAPVANPTTSYTATDQLGSPRVITNAAGEIVSRRDFMPFGEELFPDGVNRTTNQKYGSANDKIRQKFTGYQRDEETQLDFAEARYYNNQHGRFTAVDPLLGSGKSANPQTFNRYVYAINRPLIMSDPSGLQAGSPAGAVNPTGTWFKPGNGSAPVYVKNGEPVRSDYEPITRTNRWSYGTPVYAAEGLDDQHEIRLHPNGPRTPQSIIDVRTGQTGVESLSDFERNGWEVIYSDEVIEEHPGLENSIEPYDIALLGMGGGAASIGKGAMEAATNGGAATIRGGVFRGGGLHFSVTVREGAEAIGTQVVDRGGQAVVEEVGGVGRNLATRTISLPDAQAAMQFQRSLLEQGNIGTYNTLTNSCLTHVCNVLKAGGLSSGKAYYEGASLYTESFFKQLK